MSWILLCLGAAAAGFVNGLAGFGTALFALGFFLQIMPPPEAVAIVATMSLVTGLQGVWAVRGAVIQGLGRLARFLIPALIGIPLGVAALAVIDADVLKLVIGGFMMFYGGFFLLSRTLPTLSRPKPVLDALIGFISGILGGAASLSGALLIMWSAMQPWTKLQTRSLLQPFNTIVLGLTALALALKGVFTIQTLIGLAVVLPVSMVAAQVGIIVFRRLRDDQFRRFLIVLMFASGVALIGRELL